MIFFIICTPVCAISCIPVEYSAYTVTCLIYHSGCYFLSHDCIIYIPSSVISWSPRAHPHVVGMLRFYVFDTEPAELAHSFLFCSYVDLWPFQL